MMSSVKKLHMKRGAKMWSAKHAALSLSSVLPRPNPRLKLILNTGDITAMLLLMLLLFPNSKPKTIETPCAEHTTEHCVDVPIIKEIITPVETCHQITKVDCTPADHNIAKVTCTPGSTTVTDLAATFAAPVAPAPAAVDA